MGYSDDNKKGFFKKKKDKKDEQIEDLTDRLRRQMAEFENFRKRTEMCIRDRPIGGSSYVKLRFYLSVLNDFF